MTPADQLRRGRHVIVTTYRADGRPVPTIVGSVVDEQGRVCMLTRPGSGKVKRIGNNPAVNITPCDGQGRPTGPGVAGTARLLGPDETAVVRRLMTRHHPAAGLALLADRLRPASQRWTGIAVTV